MVEYASTNGITNVFTEPSINADLVTQVSSGNRVAILEHGSLFCKIVINAYEGFCETKLLSFENTNKESQYKEGPIVISLPKDCASALYNALKFSLRI